MKLPKKVAYLKYAIIAAGFLLSAVFYLRTDPGADEGILLETADADGAAFAENEGKAAGEFADSAKASAAAEGGEGTGKGIEAERTAAETAPLISCTCAQTAPAQQIIIQNLPEPGSAKGTWGSAGEGNGAVSSQAGTAAPQPGGLAAQNAGGASVPVSAEPAAETPALVNINTAGKDELMTLKGIGESRAEAIIEYRETYGAFAHIEEIMNISGIKEAAFEKIKENITV